ncbi:50S ribosomal protein L25 [Desulfallas sp. Bu1-1]|uniref:50S ribosomal protein L25 n=1 Tax=Desulfallas sp. Bu1-1 TaxID=2787620 RepID=UPI00189FDA44|nr:50S ribosomal protein L25 [Desulfallas sp. Bu1-1]MBF7082682.1 50S ribosomal protein L25 [Desulfallas sp. Bu1-1]
MADLSLQVNYREKRGKGYRNELFRKEMVPGVVYGKAVGSVPVEVALKPLKDVIAKGRSNIIDLTVLGPGAGESRNYKVLVKDMQYDPIKRVLMNIDFHQISMEEPIETTIPVNLTGEVKDGILQYGIREIRISCLPTEIPDAVTVSLDGLTVGDTVTVKDISVPEKVTVLEDPETVVVTVLAEHKAEETEAEGEPGAAETETPAGEA